MNHNVFIRTAEKLKIAMRMLNLLGENVPGGRASALITHRRPMDFIKDKVTGLLVPCDFRLVDEPELVWNVITNGGRDFIHAQAYSTASGVACGLNFIALSNDTVGESAASTTLSNEITTNNMGRVQGAVAHVAGTNTTTISNTFTCQTGAQSAQKAALFTALTNGTMNHVLGFTQRSLQVNDTLQVTFTITLG